MKILSMIALVSALTIGCANSPEMLVSPTDVVSSPLVVRTFQIENSCPHDAITLIVKTADRRADFIFNTTISGVRNFQIDVEKFTSTNTWVPVITLVDSKLIEHSFYPGRYQARIRTITCGGDSQWSAWVGFTIDGDEDHNGVPPVVVVPPVVPPPTGGGGDDGDDSGGNPGGGDNGGGGHNPPPVDGGGCTKPGQPFPDQPKIDCPPGHSK